MKKRSGKRRKGHRAGGRRARKVAARKARQPKPRQPGDPEWAPILEILERLPSEDQALLALAAKPVPIGSGWNEHGEGRHLYVKTNIYDGSVRCLGFQTREASLLASEIGMAADLQDAYGEADVN